MIVEITKKKKLLILGVILVSALFVAFLIPGEQPGEGWYKWPLHGSSAQIDIVSAQPGLPGQYQAKITLNLGVRHRAPVWNPLERADNVFRADSVVEYFYSPTPYISLGVRYSNTYRLGFLEPGVYRFRFYSNGVFVKQTSFRVIGETVEPPGEPDLRFAGGSGTADDPYQIEDWNHLHLIRGRPENCFVLINDLDATSTGYEELASPTANDGKGWLPIGTRSESFIGALDGQGYEIRDLFVNRPHDDVGLFGYVGIGGIIRDVGLVNADITGRMRVGGLVGTNSGFVSNSYSTGKIAGNYSVGGLIAVNRKGTVSNSYSTSNVSNREYWAGGLIGRNEGTVSDSYATGSVTGRNNAGGLIGWNDGTVENSYATGSVTGKDYYSGGLVGYSHSGTVINSYATGSVTGKYSVGGLVGRNDATISNSYSAGGVAGTSSVGGLVGWNDGSVSSSFWDVEASGMGKSAAGMGKTTAEMRDIATYTDTETEGLNEPWGITVVDLGGTDDSYVWNVVDGETYPFLSWEPVG